MAEQKRFFTDLTVIITTRNRIKELLITIQKCLDIGLHQNQIIVTDDASTDGTGAILQEQFPGLILHLNTSQLGYIYNRNQMMRASSSESILSLDDDSNLVSGEDLQQALDLLYSKDDYGIFGFIPVEQREAPPPKSSFKKDVYLSQSYIGCGHIIKRAALNKVGFYREEYFFYGEEIDFSIRCFKAGLHVVKQSDLIVHHRVDYKSRNVNVKADHNKGEYGILWRSEYAMANRLSHILINYPSPVMILYLTRSLSGFFYSYVIKKRWINCYRSALQRVSKRIKYIRSERDPLTLEQFRLYMSLKE